MVRFQRSTEIARGKQLEALAWAKEITDFLNQKNPEIQIQTFTTRFGNIGRIVWMVDVPDLATLDAYQQRIGEEEEYWQFVAKAVDLFIEGSFEDTVLATA